MELFFSGYQHLPGRNHFKEGSDEALLGPRWKTKKKLNQRQQSGLLCRIQKDCRQERANSETPGLRQTQYIPGKQDLFCQHSAGRSGSAADSGCHTGQPPQGDERCFREKLRRCTRRVWRQTEHSGREQIRWTTVQSNSFLCSSGFSEALWRCYITTKHIIRCFFSCFPFHKMGTNGSKSTMYHGWQK